jgi:hypothetical protein
MSPGVGSRLAMLLLTALVSVLLVSLAWPRLMASIRFLPVDRALDTYYSDNEIPTDRLLVLTGFATEAINIHDHYRFRDGLSQLHYLRGMDIHTPAMERRDAYRTSESEAMESLRQAPAQSALWLRLATIRWVLRDEPETIVEPWKMSIFTGRSHSSLYAYRVELGLAFLGYLDQEGRAMLRDQLRLAWKIRPGTLVQVLARRDPQLLLTRDLVGNGDPGLVTEMEAWLERVR